VLAVKQDGNERQHFEVLKLKKLQSEEERESFYTLKGLFFICKY
jgi:hypothetical protein